MLWWLSLALAAPAPLPVLHSVAELLAIVRSGSGPTVVHFWATWCEACVAELPELQKLEQGLSAGPARLLYVSLDAPEQAAEVANFLAEHRLLQEALATGVLLDVPDPTPVTSAFDPRQAHFTPRWTAQLPATFLLLDSGKPIASHLGSTPVAKLVSEARAQASTAPSATPRPAPLHPATP